MISHCLGPAAQRRAYVSTQRLRCVHNICRCTYRHILPFLTHRVALQRAGGPRQAKSRGNNRVRPRAPRPRRNGVQIGAGQRTRPLGRVEHKVRVRSGRELAIRDRPLGDAAALQRALQVQRTKLRKPRPSRENATSGWSAMRGVRAPLATSRRQHSRNRPRPPAAR